MSFSSAYSQNRDKDLEELLMLKNKNQQLQKRITTETSKSKDFYNLAVSNTQSGKQILRNIKGNGKEDDSQKDIATLLFDKANAYTRKSDSVLKLVNKLQDTIKINQSKIHLLGKTVRTSNLDTIIPNK